MAIMFCFGFGLISLTYVMNFFFSKSANAFRHIGTIYILLGYLAPNIVTSLTLLLPCVPAQILLAVLGFFIPFMPFYYSLIMIVIEFVNKSARIEDCDIIVF